MKLVFVNRFFYPDYSATSQLLTDLAFYLARANFKVCVITSRQLYDNANAVLSSEEEMQGVNILRIWTTRFGRQCLLGRALDYATFYVSTAWSLLKLLRSGDIIIAKTDPPLISVIAALSARVTGTSLINWIQDLFPEVAKALEVKGIRIVEPLLRRIRNQSLRSAKWNIVLGTQMAERLRDEGIPPHTIKVIHNWADGLTIQPVEREKNYLRQEWGLEEKFVVGYSGNLGRAQEFGTILMAAQLLQENENIVILFIGGGAQLPWTVREVNRKMLKNVLFKPYQPRERLMMSLSVPDAHLITLYPALEGLIVPSKLYGIAAAGRPTIFIGDKDGEISRILHQEQCGLTIPIGDHKRLADSITQFSQHPELGRGMGERARAAFDAQFDKRFAIAAWEALIQSTSRGVACSA
jgi:colanic acid biosynthesis glycosyl transferase WcaI